MIREIKSLLERCENQYIDSAERDSLRGGIEEIRNKLFNLQITRLSNHINDKGKIQNLPKEEEIVFKTPPNINIQNIYFEETPLTYIHKIVCETGIFETEDFIERYL